MIFPAGSCWALYTEDLRPVGLVRIIEETEDATGNPRFRDLEMVYLPPSPAAGLVRRKENSLNYLSGFVSLEVTEADFMLALLAR